MKPTLLLVDDDEQSLSSTQRMLEFSGYEVITATNGQEALDLLRGVSPSLIVSDVRMPKMGGLDFLKALSVRGQKIPVILMTAYGRVEDAVWAMKWGAADFLTKPFKRQKLLETVENLLKRLTLGDQPAQQTLLGSGPAMARIKRRVEQVAASQATVLITGESGTGKELVAKLIQQGGARRDKPFVALNCAAIPEQLMESELFGHAKGAFSGADRPKEGLFEAAHGGTLFLDEIGDMPVSLQSKLLRVLQEGEVRRVGSTHSNQVDVRILAATHQDLSQLCETGGFRQDLLFRLNVLEVNLPPLRDRQEDLKDLTLGLLSQAAKRHGKSVEGVDSQAWGRLKAHSWPGNVRELSNVVERAVVLCAGNLITEEDLPESLGGGKEAEVLQVEVGTSLKEVETKLIHKTLEATGGDKRLAAQLLGVNERTIYRKLNP